jgi:hypothetical protein
MNDGARVLYCAYAWLQAGTHVMTDALEAVTLVWRGGWPRGRVDWGLAGLGWVRGFGWVGPMRGMCGVC